jgi:hypothetical protein
MRRSVVGLAATGILVAALDAWVPVSAAAPASPAVSSAPRGEPTESGFRIASVSDPTQVCQLTGHGAFNDTAPVEIAGTDLGSMFETADGRTWFAFGDTFGERPEGMTGGGGTIWRSNTLAWTTDTDPSDCIRFDGWVADTVGWAAEVLPSKKQDGTEITVIPTYGFEAGDALYLHYMSVKEWGPPGVWTTNLAGLARSTDGGQTWQKLEDVTWPGEGSFQEVSVAKHDGDLLFWGVPSGRLGGVSLMTVPEADVEDIAAYRYLSGLADDGQPEWSSDPADAITIIDRPTGELSVVWNADLGRWLMTTMADNADAVLYEGLAPWVPWSEPHSLFTQAELPGLYAPFLHRGYIADEGRTIWFGLSEWLHYNVFWYRADLILAEDAASE